MQTSLHRRRFLKQALAASAVLSGTVAAASPVPLRFRDPRPVVVIGAGLSGLAVAAGLKRAGESVLVLETRTVPGGRVRTLREGFADTLYGEAGPTRIADVHHRCLLLAAELGLQLEICEPQAAAMLFVHRGCRFGAAEACDRADPFLELGADERGLTVAELVRRYVGELPALLGGAGAAPSWHEHDRLSWPAWLASRGASPAAIALMTLGAAPTHLSALYVLRQIALHREVRQYFRIAGGMDRLPAALAARLGTAVSYGITAARIEHDRDGVRVHVFDADGQHVVDARSVVLTLPPPVLRRIVFDPPLTAAKRRALDAVPGYAAARCALQTRTRFWRESGLDGAARTDAPAEIGEASFGRPGARGLLHVTASAPVRVAVGAVGDGDAVGEDAVGDTHVFAKAQFRTPTYLGAIDEARLTRRDPGHPRIRPGGTAGEGAIGAVHGFRRAPEDTHTLEHGVACAAAAFPGIESVFECGTSIRWADEPAAGGAFAAFPPGQMATAPALLARAEGRLHFAGEHTSVWTGWMEGALDSAARVCRELGA